MSTRSDTLSALNTVRATGHLHAKLDPLGLRQHPLKEELSASEFACLNAAETYDAAELGLQGVTGQMTPRQAYDHLQTLYCGTMTMEAGHVLQRTEREWLYKRYEELQQNRETVVTATHRKNANALLQMAETFENFLATKFTTLKRYSGEGAESMLSFIDAFTTASGRTGDVTDIVIGMPHRGRLALLVSLMNYPAHRMLAKLRSITDYGDEIHALDDVSSHIANSTDRYESH